MKKEEVIEIPFGAKDSELKGWEYTIPDGMEAEIKDGKVIVRKKESDDERALRIIKKRMCYEPAPISDEDRRIVENWLEKQKEQKPADDKAFEDWIDDWWKHNKVKNLDSYDKGYEIQFDKNGFKNFCHRIRDMYQQNPVEWSKEDENTLENLHELITFGFTEKFFDAQTVTDMRDWINTMLKSLRPAQKLNEEEIKKIRSEEYTKGFNDAAFGGKQQEWSEEDEDRIRQIERIAQAAGCTQKLQEEIHDWLKSRRPSAKTKTD